MAGGIVAAFVTILLEIVGGLFVPWQVALIGGAILLAIGVVCSSLITQMSYVELCKLARRGRPRHGHDSGSMP